MLAASFMLWMSLLCLLKTLPRMVKRLMPIFGQGLPDLLIQVDLSFQMNTDREFRLTFFIYKLFFNNLNWHILSHIWVLK